MENDYPAAHSMDTTWFAVDAVGHVGVFESWEDGHVPETAIDAHDLLAGIWSLDHPGEEESLSIEDLAAALGAFIYHYDNSDDSFDQIALYRRTTTPEVPLHLDQLPPTLRQQAKQVQFHKVDFSQNELVQPLEEYPCVFWYEEDTVAYLCSDGKKVQPMPGKEGRFAEFCKQFRDENPEEAKKYIFEEPPQ